MLARSRCAPGQARFAPVDSGPARSSNQTFEARIRDSAVVVFTGASRRC